MEEILRKKLGSYNKSNIDINKFKNGIINAVDNSKLLDNKPENRWPLNPGTHVYKVVEEITKLSNPNK